MRHIQVSLNGVEMTAGRIPIWIVRRGKNGQGTVNEQHTRTGKA